MNEPQNPQGPQGPQNPLVVQGTPDRRTRLEREVGELRTSMSSLEAKFAEARPVQDVVKLLLYFWAAISVILGIFGWKQFSDIETMVHKQVQLTLPADRAKYAEYDQLIDNTKKLYGDFEKLTANYKERVKDLGYVSQLSTDSDIEMQMKKVVDEADPDHLNDVAWASRAVFTLTKFREMIKTKMVSAELIFNSAQLCRQLAQSQLGRELTEAAYNRDPTPSNHAMYLASVVADGKPDEREQAFSELMGVVSKLGPENPHIVLSEGWNAAEATSQYQRLLDVLLKLLRDRGSNLTPQDYVPSYAHLIVAEIYLRQGLPGTRVKAREYLGQGLARLQDETTHSQWFGASVNQAKTVEHFLEEADALQENRESKVALR